MEHRLPQGAVIAIHHSPGSFSDRWVQRLSGEGIPHRAVNGYGSSIVAELRDCAAFLWHITHRHTNDLLYARSVLRAAANIGLVVFPNETTCYHYDDKIAQKYLLEFIGAPLVPTWVFYKKEDVLCWVDSADFPKVFKLRRGAGSANVRLVRSRGEAARLVERMFSRGFHPRPGLAGVIQAQGHRTRSVSALFGKMKKIGSYVRERRSTPTERGYAYFQEFVPDNDLDTRVTIIGNRAFYFDRLNRRGDFRASGSGRIVYMKPQQMDMRAIEVAFGVSRRLGFQSMAYDFLTDRTSGRKLLTEISYIFDAGAVHDCEGHFDSAFTWHEGHFWPQDAILEDVLASVEGGVSRGL
jgi:glutathione synthase/RimK-type ligase-like ATP-grasp enzyme